MPRWEPADEFVHIGKWRADPRADELCSDDQTVKLEPLKMRLLLALAERPGEVLLTQELLDRVWGDVVVTSASVYQGIAQLRRVLGDGADPSQTIETVPRKGYRLLAPVRRQPREESAAQAGELASSGQDTDALLTSPPPVPAAAPSGRRFSIGRRRLLIGTGALGAAGSALWYYLDALPPARPVRIAVLPFADRTQGAGEAALSQGLALDVIRALERYRDVFATAPESVLAAAPGRAVAEIGS